MPCEDYVVSLSPDPLGTTRYNLGMAPNEVLDLAADSCMYSILVVNSPG